MQREKITYYVRSIYEYVFLQFAHVVLLLRAATSISRQVSSKLFSAIIIWSIFLDFPIGRGWQRLNSVYLLSADVHTHYLRNEDWMGDISANVYTDHSYQIRCKYSVCATLSYPHIKLSIISGCSPNTRLDGQLLCSRFSFLLNEYLIVSFLLFLFFLLYMCKDFFIRYTLCLNRINNFTRLFRLLRQNPRN